MKKLLLLSFCISLIACGSQKKLMQKCKDLIPPCDSARVEYRVVSKTDTLWKPVAMSNLPLLDIRCFEFVDSSRLELNLTPLRFIPCPVVENTKIEYSTIYLRDTFELNECRADLAKSSEVIEQKKKTISTLYWVLGAVSFLLLLVIAIIVYIITKKK